MAFRHLLGTSDRTPPILVGPLGRPRNLSAGTVHLCDMAAGVATSHGFDPLLTLAELALRLGVSRQTLCDLRRQGRGPAGFRIGRELRFRTSEVEAWITRLEQQDRTRHRAGDPR